MLGEQTANIRRFGGERYTSTELDLLGNAIWRLLRPPSGRTGARHVVDPGRRRTPSTPARVTLRL